jgi:hypothetical protein
MQATIGENILFASVLAVGVLQKATRVMSIWQQGVSTIRPYPGPVALGVVFRAKATGRRIIKNQTSEQTSKHRSGNLQ